MKSEYIFKKLLKKFVDEYEKDILIYGFFILGPEGKRIDPDEFIKFIKETDFVFKKS